MRIVQLSVSSIILAGVLSGCSQNHLASKNQVSSQPVAAHQRSSLSHEIAELLKPERMPPNSYYESKAHRQKRLARLKQVALKERRAASLKPVNSTPKQGLQFKKVVYKAKPVSQKQRPGKKIIAAPGHYTRHHKKLVKPTLQAKRSSSRLKRSAKYVTKSKRVILQKATSKRVLVRAPQYRWVNKKVLVRKASYKTRVIPAKYKTVAKKRILLRPAKSIRTLVPAVYRTVKQKIRVAPALYKTVKTAARYKTQNYRQKPATARYVWKSTRGNVNKLQSPTSKSAGTLSARTPQRQSLVNKSIARLDEESGYMKLDSNYNHAIRVTNTRVKNISKDVLLLLDQVKLKKTSKIKNKKYSHRIKKSKRHLNRAEKKRQLVIRIQKSLKSRGFYIGSVDGKLGAKTAAALEAFQNRYGLEVGKLDKKTFHALGLKLGKKSS